MIIGSVILFLLLIAPLPASLNPKPQRLYSMMGGTMMIGSVTSFLLFIASAFSELHFIADYSKAST